MGKGEKREEEKAERGRGEGRMGGEMFKLYALKCFRKNTPTSGGVKGGKMGSEARVKGLYLGPISSSENAPYVAFSLKVTYGNVERAN